MSFRILALLAMFAAAAWQPIFAQQTRPVVPPSASTLAPAMQQQMVDWLIVDQQSMLGLAQFGQQSSVRAEVQQLAQTMQADHAAMLQQLRDYRPRDNRDGSPEAAADRAQTDRRRQTDVRDDVRNRREANNDARRNADGIRRPLENIVDRVEDVGERIGEGARNLAEDTREAVDDVEDRVDAAWTNDANRSSPWLTLHREITDQIGRDAVAQLSRYRGREAEEAFLGTILSAHLQGRATMKVFASHADGQLRSILETALQQTQQHEITAGRLMAKIEE